ncbi:MAG: GGDEF domain-containing protein [Candidatus Accumulibacter propinquus]|jgi:diguanylate cyclase (GGDEF)-like protein
MSTSPYRLPLVDLRADDAEIGNYAALLDSLNIGLLVFDDDGALRLRNAHADHLLGAGPGIWEDENGQPLAAGDRLERQVIQTRQPVRQRAVGIRRDPAGARTWCKASAFPVFSGKCSLRRVLLTLADLSQDNRLATENPPLPTHDALTGVFSERYISLLLDDEDRRARRYGTPFALALVTPDHYSDFCAKHGAQAAESVLAHVGRVLGRGLREFDMVGRLGEAEFLLILPNVRVNDAMHGLERLREMVESSHPGDGEPALTISGGVTECTGEDAAVLIERVRSLLANACEAGGNRLCVDLEIF